MADNKKNEKEEKKEILSFIRPTKVRFLEAKTIRGMGIEKGEVVIVSGCEPNETANYLLGCRFVEKA